MIIPCGLIFLRRVLLTWTLYTAVLSAAPGEVWTDPGGDVTLPNADIVSGSATVISGMVDLRVQFADAPFPNTATHDVHWFFDLDQNPATGENYVGANAFGIEKFLHITVRLSTGGFSNCEIFVDTAINGFDVHSHLWFDPASDTLRLFFPVSLLQDDGLFNYVLDSTFGGSFGANERAPDTDTLTSAADALASFNGILWCPSANDGDGDGVPDERDQCPATFAGSVVNEHGCSIDQLVPCDGPAGGGTWRNHGEYVLEILRTATAFHKAGLITATEQRAIVRTSVKADCGRRHNGSK